MVGWQLVVNGSTGGKQSIGTREGGKMPASDISRDIKEHFCSHCKKAFILQPTCYPAFRKNADLATGPKIKSSLHWQTLRRARVRTDSLTHPAVDLHLFENAAPVHWTQKVSAVKCVLECHKITANML